MPRWWWSWWRCSASLPWSHAACGGGRVSSRTMRPLPPPFDTMAAGLPTTIDLSGPTLLSNRLLNKDFAFTADERRAFGLRGLLPDRVMTIEEQVQLELERIHRKDDPLEQYIGLAALHLVGAALLWHISGITEPAAFFWTLLAYGILYMPTLGLANAIAFHQMSDPGQQFPGVRVMGTLGWIVVGLIMGILVLNVYGRLFTRRPRSGGSQPLRWGSRRRRRWSAR